MYIICLPSFPCSSMTDSLHQRSLIRVRLEGGDIIAPFSPQQEARGWGEEVLDDIFIRFFYLLNYNTLNLLGFY